MPHDIQKISLRFNAYQRATVEQARELIVIITERFIELINAHEKIRPYLREYPVTQRTGDIVISFCMRNNHSYTDGSVSHVFQGKKIFYEKEDSTNPTGLTTIHEESYEKALEIVRNKQVYGRRAAARYIYK